MNQYLKEKYLQNRYLRNKYFLAGMAAFCLLLGMAFFWHSHLNAPKAGSDGKTVLFRVESGMSAANIADQLKKDQLIDNVAAFRTEAKISGLEKSLQAGAYRLTRGMSVRQIIDVFAAGKVEQIAFTVPEGYTVTQIAELIEQLKLGKKARFLELARSYAPYEYMQTENPDVVYKVEGFLFPSTYYLSADMNEKQILTMMAAEFNKRFTSEKQQQLAANRLTARQWVTMGSLVEKEAQVETDRPLIAGVFYNRLHDQMPLQSCATIQYIIGYPKAELTVADTERPSPYNTYLHPGLPPGPIANPGAAALTAALEPAQTEYEFFVVQQNGAHRFSRTYDEHLQAIQQVSGQ